VPGTALGDLSGRWASDLSELGKYLMAMVSVLSLEFMEEKALN
jgi:hypothetical protein